MSSRTPEQRRRDGRLAWIIVSACAAVSLTLVVAVGIGLRGTVARWAATQGQQALAAPARESEGPQVQPVGTGLDLQRRRAPAGGGAAAGTLSKQAGRVAPPPRGQGEGGVLQKQGSDDDGVARKSGGGDDSPDQDEAPEPADDTPPAHRI